MGKLVRQCDMEVMKMAMLKHEETFRQQVHELHRLYRIQTQLMGASATGRQPRRRSSKQPRRALDLQLPADQYIVGAGAGAEEDEDGCGTELELTLAVGGRRPACVAATRKNSSGGFSSPFASDDCSGGGGSATSLSSSPPSSVEYPVALHGYALPMPPPPPCQRAMAFDHLGASGEAMVKYSPWQLVQCQQYLSLRMT